MRLSEIASCLGLSREGADLEIERLAGLDDAGPTELSFVHGERNQRALQRSRAGAVLAPQGLDVGTRACLRSPEPYADFARAVDLFHPPPRQEPGVHPTAIVAAGVELGSDVSIGAYAVIGAGARIGSRTAVYPHVTIYPGAAIGADCTIHAGACIREGAVLADRVVVQNGAVVGSDGFGFAFRADGTRVRVPHRGGVELGSGVEVGANSTIDRSHPAHPRDGRETACTRVGSEVKIDNLVQVGHGCTVGASATLCAQVGLGGGTRVGHHTYFGGQSASAGHVAIGDGVMVAARGAVTSNVPSGAQVAGTPTMERRAWGRFTATRKRLPGLLRRVRRIEEHLGLRAPDAEG